MDLSLFYKVAVVAIIVLSPLSKPQPFEMVLSPTKLTEVLGGDEPPHNASLTVTDLGSDWGVHVDWSFNQSYCDCTNLETQTLNLTVTQAGFGQLLYAPGTAPTTDFLLDIGPAKNYALSYNMNFIGERSWHRNLQDPCSIFATCIGFGVSCGCDYNYGGSGIAANTVAIKNPTNVSATDGLDDNSITISWGKGTDIPDFFSKYRIYKNGVFLIQVNGDVRSYIDGGLAAGQNFTYTVRTYSTTVHGTYESSGVMDAGSTFSVGAVASDGAYANRTLITWNDLSDVAEDIRVERNVPGTANREELAIMAKTAKSYNDQGGIAGYQYTYYVTPLAEGMTFSTGSDPGFSRPNGSIKGYVKSKFGAGVSGVDIDVTLLDVIPAGAVPHPVLCPLTSSYCATTNSEGYYEVKDIYYYTGAEFTIVPSKTGTVTHGFTPDTSWRILDENVKAHAAVDFVDTTVFTIAGRVTYPEHNSVVCGVGGAKILINDLDYGILTDGNGDWSFAISDEAMYTFEVEYFDHEFENGSGQSTTTLDIAGNVFNIDFENITTDDLKVTVQGGCQASLADSIHVLVTAPGGCFNEIYTVDASGLLMIEDLPARDYSVEVMELFDLGNPNISNIFDQIGERPISIDLTLRDSATNIVEVDSMLITPADTLLLPNGDSIFIAADTTLQTVMDTISGEIEPAVRFIYRSPLSITINFVEAGATKTECLNSEGDTIILMEQGTDYLLQIEVRETLGSDCYVDSGFLKIYDFIGDNGNNAVRIPINGGFASYQVSAGEPEVAISTFHNHEKLFYVIPEVDLAPADGVDFWVLVTGTKSNTPSFISRSPEIPMLILHDPPGGNSFSYIEKGTTFKSFYKNEVLIGGDAGGFLNLVLGAKILTPFSGNGFGTLIKFSAKAGRDNFNRNGIETSITFTDKFQTSDAPNLSGPIGDLYIGAAFNQGFSLAERLEYKPDSCKSVVDIIPAISVESFATTFVYTEYHIKNTLIPTLGKLIKEMIDDRPVSMLTEEEKVEVNKLRADSVMWSRILVQNNRNRDSTAIFDENISFSAGGQVSKEYTLDTTTSTSYQYNQFVNTEFALGAKIDNESGIWFDSELGFMGAFRASVNTDSGNDTTTTTTVGYVLDDSDIGDFFSVDILKDTAYNVPAFRLKLGTSSCPQEAGTQARDRPQIKILPPELNNVPTDGVANFTCQLTNLSESFETREYNVRVVTVTNPEGAQVALGSASINSIPQAYFLQRGQTLNVNLSVAKGPVAANYERIGVMMYPECEYLLWQDNGTLINSDTAYFTVNFQSECTNVSLVAPDDGWLVNQNDNDILQVTLSGYDVNNEFFTGVTVQIKREGQGYAEQITIPKANLTGPYYDIYLNVANFDDGEYRLRARANCGDGVGYTYSSELRGAIDRHSLAPFGTPSPSDGFLQEGQEVSVTYDKQIDCMLGTYPYEITLTRMDDSTDISISEVQCLNNKIILVTDPPLIDRPELEGILVAARVHLLQDLTGNIQKYPVNWSFLVNVKPVFWDPENLYASGTIGQPAIIKGVLKNNARLSKAFSLDTSDAPQIIEIPDWLTPIQKRGTILSNNDYTVEFVPDPDLTPGIYTGTVTAAVNGLPVSMVVTFELLARPVNWSFNPTIYEKSMTVVAQFSLTAANAPLSTDTRDVVAAFVNGEIRGIGNITYIPELNSYAAFLTVFSNSNGGTNGEQVRFRFWKALSGVEYGAVETVTFQPDGKVGSPTSPHILHPEGIYQVIPLRKGWNWVSFNVQTSDMTREKLFQSLIYPQATNTITVNAQGSTCAFTPASGWNGALKTLALGPGYLVHLSDHLDTLRVVGNPPVNPVAHNIGNTWNWIGFPEQTPRDVDSVLTGLSPAANNVLKGQFSFSQYTNGVSGWIGNLTQFEPGKGYKLQYPVNGTIQYRDPGVYDLQPGMFEYSMNVFGTLDPSELEQADYRDLRVGAFINGVCHGVAEVEYVPLLDAYRVLLQVMSNLDLQDQPIEFRVLNKKTGKEFIANGDQLAFGPDDILGTVFNPYDFFPNGILNQGEVGEYVLKQNQPNPLSDMTFIDFKIPEPAVVRINLYDLNGTLIKTIAVIEASAGWQSVEADLSELPGGVYLYRMVTSGFSATKKLIKN